MLDKTLRTIEKYRMLSRGDTVVVAVSGGTDSVVLLHVLDSLKDHLGIRLHVAHLNHGIRGTDADEDAGFVAELSRSYGLPYSIGKVSVPELQKQWKVGMEEAARKARYEFLQKIANEVGAARIATAHTAGDQVETVLMNIIRGSGIEGLGGMRPVQDNVIRPLIETSRDEVEDYRRANQLSYREDVTNLDVTYTRNRVRRELLPALKAYNPRIDEAVLRLAEASRDDSQLLEEIAGREYGKLAERTENRISFPVVEFRQLPTALQRRLLRLAVGNVLGSLADIGFLHVENLLERLDTPGVYEVELPPGTARARKTDEDVSVYLIEHIRYAPEVQARTLDVPGRTEIPEIGLTVTAEAITTPVDWRRPRESMDVVVDADNVAGMLTVRTRLPGDRIVPLGMKHSKKLQDLFVDRKIPREKRGRLPLIADEEKILWIAGVALSQCAAVSPHTTRFLRIAVEEHREV